MADRQDEGYMIARDKLTIRVSVNRLTLQEEPDKEEAIRVRKNERIPLGDSSRPG